MQRIIKLTLHVATEIVCGEFNGSDGELLGRCVKWFRLCGQRLRQTDVLGCNVGCSVANLSFFSM